MRGSEKRSGAWPKGNPFKSRGKGGTTPPLPVRTANRIHTGLEMRNGPVETGVSTNGAVITVAWPDLTPWEERQRQVFLLHRRQTIEGILAMGAVLLEVKGVIEHGRWLRWLNAAGVAPRTAQKLMCISGCVALEELSAQKNSPLPPAQETLYQLAQLPEYRFDQLLAAGKIHPEMKRHDVRAALVALEHCEEPPELAPVADGKYRVILADPPWRFVTRGPGGTGKSPDQHYPTMALDDILALPIHDLAATDCALFLWITSDHLPFTHKVMADWGFEWKTSGFYWFKERNGAGLGKGYYTRKDVEACMLGTRGSPKVLAHDVREAVFAPRREHSEKPEEVRERIQRLFQGPYIEVFSRHVRAGWDAWGNDPAVNWGR